MKSWRTSAGPVSHAGFTLIELLVVLVLATITITFAGLGVNALMERSQYHESVRRVQAQLSVARLHAMREAEPTRVTFQPLTRSLWVNGREVWVAPESVLTVWTPVSGLGIPDGEGDMLFFFDADGFGYGGNITVGRGTTGTQFSVNWLLGRIDMAVVAMTAP